MSGRPYRWDADSRPADPRHAPDDDLVRCRACNAEAERCKDGPIWMPEGWLQLKISGPFGPGDPFPGPYCCAECLTTSLLSNCYGIGSTDARTWLRGLLDSGQ